MKETKQAEYLPITKLHPFAGHPFKVQDNEEMDALVESILSGGILTPLMVRPLDGKTDEYEVISGHRRLHAAIKAGMETVPAFITPMNRDAAIIALVDSNLHREHILPSEKAFAYKLKMDALSKQGQRTDLTSRQVVGKLETADMIADNESGRQVQRYIRLTHLLPELLQKVDAGQVAFTPAVHLSFLSPAEQGWVLDEMERNDCTPSVAQAYHLKAHSLEGTLSRDYVAGLMSREKANQKERLKIPMERIRKYFPKNYTTAQMEDEIVKMCEARFRSRSGRDAR